MTYFFELLTNPSVLKQSTGTVHVARHKLTFILLWWKFIRVVISILVWICETERTLKSRFMEHRRPSSTTSEVSKHINIDNQGHEIILDQAKILDRESSWYERGVKEAIYIRALRPSLNRDGGRFQLPHIWVPLLISLRERCWSISHCGQSAEEVVHSTWTKAPKG